ncbi:MAG TPA: hypothetical protein VM123_06570 [archaeon]|nr:hypothetical protein [archaeon]
MACPEGITTFFKEFWKDIRSEGTDNLHTLLYLFILLGFFLLVLSFSYPRF